MISVIICSRDEDYFQQIEQNIFATIGAKFEIVKIANADGRHSIFEAYNIGQALAKYELLVYVHEDVRFHTKSWGNILINYFAEIPKLGCLGIAGATYKTKAPSGWSDVEEGAMRMYLIQHLEDRPKELMDVGWPGTITYSEVAVIDGVFMATKKSSNLRFDTAIPGFHCYDLNLSFAASQKGLVNLGTKDILLEHYSWGLYNKQWVVSTHLLHQKYKRLLPLKCQGSKIAKQRELDNLMAYICAALKFKLRSIALHYWLRLIRCRPYSRYHLQVLKGFMNS